MAKTAKGAQRSWAQIERLWGDAALPVPTGKEALELCDLLWEWEMDGAARPWRAKRITSGARHTWVRRGVLSVNPNEDGKGVAEIVHSMSHIVHLRKNPDERPHSRSQARIELRLTMMVIRRWAA